MTRMPLWLAAGAVCAAALSLAIARPRPTALPADPRADRPADSDAVIARTLAKHFVATEVARGRLTVPEAAAVFGWLNRLPPPTDPAEHVGGMSGISDAARRSEPEVLCAQVMTYRAAAVRNPNPAREADLVWIGQAQIRLARGLDGRPLLPAVNEADCRELIERATVLSRRQNRAGPVDFDALGEGLTLVVR